jgi:hypothetical protein
MQGVFGANTPDYWLPSITLLGVSMLTQASLKELLHYDPETGLFTWIAPLSNRVKVGDVCDSKGPLGYILIGVRGTRLYAHRLAWLYMTGEWPTNMIDHINCVRDDNRWSNLREATKSQNMRNAGVRKQNTSGHTGVGFHAQTKKWRAFISDDQKNYVHVGLFDTIEEAVAARKVAAAKHYGEFFHAD